MVAQVHPDCINASNPYHECTDYCFRKISERKSISGGTEAKASSEAFADLPKEFGKKQQPRKRRGDSLDQDQTAGEDSGKEDDAPPPNVFARSVDEPVYKRAGEREDIGAAEGGAAAADGRGGGLRGPSADEDEEEDAQAERSGRGAAEEASGSGASAPVLDAPSYENMSERQKKLFDLKMKMNQARKANESAVLAEKRREDKAQEAPQETRGMSKAKWYEERKQRMSKVLDANGLDMDHAFMLDTQDAAEEKYKKWEKKEAAFGWDVFNQKSLYKAYEKRTANVPVDMEEYQRQKESDPNFYRDSSYLEYGKTPDLPKESVDRMVAELDERGKKKKEFSRRRRYHDEKDIDSINDRNEHFNRKIERAFGKYTIEIKNNLERGTALPD